MTFTDGQSAPSAKPGGHSRLPTAVCFFFMLFAGSCEAAAPRQFSAVELKASARDARGFPEVHLLLTGIKGPTKNIRVQTETATFDIPWSWEQDKADIWLSVGQWKTLTLQLTYPDGSRDVTTIQSSPASAAEKK